MAIPPLPPHRTGLLDRGDCRLYFEVTGTGPALVFAHGLGGNHLSWWQQVAHFAPRYTCITFAHRGFAPSSALPGGPDPADFAEDLAALVDHLGVADDLRLVVQSMGGWTAVEYGLRRPGRLKGLVMAATTGSVDPRRLPPPFPAAVARWAAEAGPRREAMAAAGIHPAAGERMAAEQPALHLLYTHINELNAALDKEALRARMTAQRTRAPEELAAIGCPILLLANAEDAVMPPVAAAGIAGVVPGARAQTIERAGHSAYFERAAAFNEAIGVFLETLP